MSQVIRRRPWRCAAIAGALLASVLTASTSSGASSTPSGHVLLVGTWKGVTGQYLSIQAAVNAAQPGDWILVAPGDYREQNDMTNPPSGSALREGGYGSILITKDNLHLRGLNRNAVIIDGTSTGTACNSVEANQNFGPVVNGQALGRNGIVVYKANDVSIDNLTTCNFTGGAGDTGNNIWWNGGAGSGQIGLTGYSGSYLTATDQFFSGNSTAGTYGIFSSDAAGSPTTVWNNVYGANFNDSGMYVGACRQLCNITINNAYMTNNALGYSGTNSGGSILIENSTFTNNQDGLDTNTQIAGDPPAGQNGACPPGQKPKIKGATTCWILYKDTFSYNNNAHVPHSGTAADGPLGTGITISGGRNDTVMESTFVGNNAWGMLVLPFADSDTPPAGVSCTNTGGTEMTGLGCIYDPQNVHIVNNKFSNNGGYKNITNSDIGYIDLFGGVAQSCFTNNKNGSKSAITYPPNLQKQFGICTGALTSADPGARYPVTSLFSTLVTEVLCDTGFSSCPQGANYPHSNTVILAPRPTNLPTMANPCLGVPDNGWCRKGKLI